jgi:hypothetical protein
MSVGFSEWRLDLRLPDAMTFSNVATHLHAVDLGGFQRASMRFCRSGVSRASATTTTAAAVSTLVANRHCQ